MIDEDWLKSLRFESLQGVQVTGLVATGSTHVVLDALTPEGEHVVLKTYRHALGFHIKEIPPFITAKKEYDVGRVNEKLRRLIGRDDLDDMTAEYDRLYSSITRLVQEIGVPGAVLRSAMQGLLDDEMLFLLKTPGMRRRLQHWATMREEARDSTDLILIVNGPNFPMTIPRVQLIAWARKTLREIEELPPPANLAPESLTSNPLYVWGAAVMDGFFTDDELPAVADYIEQHFGRLPARDDIFPLLNQCTAIAELMTFYLKESEVARFVKLCAACGLHFQPRSRPHVEDAEDTSDDDDGNESDASPSRPSGTSWWQRMRRRWSGS